MAFSYPQLLQVSLHLRPHGGEFGFEAGDVGLHGVEVDLGLFFEGIDVAGDVEIKIVVGDLLRGGAVGVFFHGLEGLIRVHDLLDVLVGEQALVLGVLVLAGGVDEEDIAGGAGFAEDQNGGGDAGAEEEIRRQADDGLQQVFLDELLPDLALRRTAKQHAMRDDDANLSRALAGGLDHVGDEGPVALRLGRQAAMVAIEGIAFDRLFLSPFVEGEGRIGHHDIELHEVISLDEARIPQGVSPLDAEVVHAVEEHVHPAEGMGGAIHLLTEEGEIPLIGLSAHLDQQRAGTAGGIADGLALLWREQPGQQAGDLTGCVELARFFSGIGGEALQQILIHIPDDVLLPDDGGPEVEPWIGEVLEEHLEPGIAVAGLTELGLGIEVHLAEHAFELGLVCLFDAGKGDIHALADVGLIALGVEAEEVTPLRELEALAGQATLHSVLVVVVFTQVGIPVVAPYIGHVFPEEHHEDVIPVVLSIDDASEGVAGTPGDVVDFGLVDFGHDIE